MSISPTSREPSSEWQRVPRERTPEATRTTLALERDLLAAIDHEVLEGACRSRSEFVNAAVLAELRRRENDAIDAAFRSMAADPDYQAEMSRIATEFASADAESWTDLQADLGPPTA